MVSSTGTDMEINLDCRTKRQQKMNQPESSLIYQQISVEMHICDMCKYIYLKYTYSILYIVCCMYIDVQYST